MQKWIKEIDGDDFLLKSPFNVDVRKSQDNDASNAPNNR